MPGASDDKDKNKKPGPGDQDDPNQNPDDQGNDEDNDEDDIPDDFKDPKKALAEIKKLRQENAKHRTKNKALETDVIGMKEKLSNLSKALGGQDDQDDPVKKAASLQESNDELQARLAMKQLAIDHDIPKDQQEFFEFMIQKEAGALKDNEELSEEQIAAVVTKVKAASAKPGPNSTGLNDGKGKGKKPDNNAEPTADQFAKMSHSDKQALYIKNSDLYQKLFDEAKSKGLLFR